MIVSPSYLRREPPQQSHVVGGGDPDALARQMLGERLARGPLAGVRRDRRRLGCGLLDGDLVLSGGVFEVLGFQFHLVEDPCGALRTRPVDLAFELGDFELLARDRGRVVGGLGTGQRKLGFNLCGPGALGCQRAFSASMSRGESMIKENHRR